MEFYFILNSNASLAVNLCNQYLLMPDLYYVSLRLFELWKAYHVCSGQVFEAIQLLIFTFSFTLSLIIFSCFCHPSWMNYFDLSACNLVQQVITNTLTVFASIIICIHFTFETTITSVQSFYRMITIQSKLGILAYFIFSDTRKQNDNNIPFTASLKITTTFGL